MDLNKEIKMTWALAFVGIKKDFISINDCLNTTELISEESKENVLNFIEQRELANEQEILKAYTIWLNYFLNRIIDLKDDVHNKLREIANIWAMFDYPKELKPYIYYMPSSLGTNSEEELYNQFLKFIKEENKKIDNI